MPISRNVTIKDVFAKDASTTIPATPVTGTSYRNTSVSKTNVKKGWPFKTIVDSSNFNEILYELSSICKAIEDYGFLPWSNLTNYVVNSVCLGSDGKIYQATQASGPSSAAKDPTSTTGYWTEFGIDKFVTLATEQTVTQSKIFKATQYIGNSSITKGTAPASATYYGLYFVDKNGTNWSSNQLGQIQMQCAANGDNVLNLNAIQQTAGSTNSAGIKVAIKQDGTKYTSAPVPTEDTTSSTQIDTVGARNTKLASYALDSDVMHLTGNESASGYKTFTNNIIRKGSWTAGTPGSGNQTSYIQFADSTGTVYGSIGKFYGSGGTFRTEMTGKKTDGTGEISISIGYDNNGNPRALAPTPDSTTQTTSTQIATTGWVNSAGNNVMHLTGDESVAGDKTFKGKIIRKGSFTIGTLPSSTSQANIEFDDNANTTAGSVNTQYTTSGSLETRLRVRKIGTSGFDGITVGSDSSGNIYTYAPTPSSSTDNSTKIATTAWVAGHRCTKKATTTSSASVDAPAYVVENYKNGENWYRVWSDGWIEQGGATTGTGAEDKTINLHKAMSTTTYNIKLTPNLSSSDVGGIDECPASFSRATTSFHISQHNPTLWSVCGY